MESLFDQLKSETPINKFVNEPPPARSSCSPPARTATPPMHSPPPLARLSSPPLDTPSPPLRLSSPALDVASPTASSPITTKENAFTPRFESLEPKGVASPRRESMPPPSSVIVTKSNNKSRSLSPTNNKLTKPFKVLVERKKMLVKNSPEQQKIAKSKGQASKCVKNGEKSSQKFTPTKAQQKLFDPAVLEKAKQLKQLKIKCCKVRVQRQNLKTLQQQLLLKKKTKKAAKKQQSSTSILF